jgi:LPS-assembly protein
VTAKGSKNHFFLVLGLALTALGIGRSPMAAAPAGQWRLCPAPLPEPSLVSPSDLVGSTSENTVVSANRYQGVPKGVSRLFGNVVFVQGKRRGRADRARYSRPQDKLWASGHVKYQSPALDVNGTHGHFRLNADHGEFFDTQFKLPQRHGRGRAAKVKLIDSKHDALNGVTYTTCPPGNDAWILHAPTLHIDKQDDIARAYNVYLKFFGVPIFYTPYISIPLSDKRKSGFLTPMIGESSRRGFDVRVPYYFNLAPNYDATLTPRIMTKRGVDIGAQFRYLFPNSHGQLDLHYLPNDRVRDRDRALQVFSDSSRIAAGWNFNTSIQHASDDYYFDDLGENQQDIARTVLQQRADLTHGSANWYFRTRLQGFQILNPHIPQSSSPYRLLPQITLNGHSPGLNPNLDYNLHTELTRFQRSGRINALRYDLSPDISYTFGTSGYYLTPKARFDVSRYNLFNAAPDRDKIINRALPLLSLDSGLVFEKSYSGSLIQTLEPRLYYLYVPYRNQENIPIFDTRRAEFNYVELFNDNRFNSIDRIGDANQLSYALTTRFVRPDTGNELLSLSIGQIRYFEDRRVTLPGRAPQTRPFSDVVGELRVRINGQWNASARTEYNTHHHRVELGEVQLQYQPGPGKVINLAYRLRRGLLEQTDFSIAWPITKHWRAVGRWNYSLRDQSTLESFEGVEYDTCCWAFNILHRSYVNNNGDVNSAVYLQLQLKGLASIGEHIEDFLRRGILGYYQP